MREVEEWIGDNPAYIPTRVKVRRFRHFGGVCQICFTKIISGPEYDHRIALSNGGEHREANLFPVHPKCHRLKTKADVAIKSETYRTQVHHLGIKKPRRPMPGSKASGIRKRMNGNVERW